MHDFEDSLLCTNTLSFPQIPRRIISPENLFYLKKRNYIFHSFTKLPFCLQSCLCFKDNGTVDNRQCFTTHTCALTSHCQCGRMPIFLVAFQRMAITCSMDLIDRHTSFLLNYSLPIIYLLFQFVRFGIFLWVFSGFLWIFYS